MFSYSVRYKISGIVIALHTTMTPLPARGDTVIWDGNIRTTVSDIMWAISNNSSVVEITLTLD